MAIGQSSMIGHLVPYHVVEELRLYKGYVFHRRKEENLVQEKKF